MAAGMMARRLRAGHVTGVPGARRRGQLRRLHGPPAVDNIDRRPDDQGVMQEVPPRVLLQPPGLDKAGVGRHHAAHGEHRLDAALAGPRDVLPLAALVGDGDLVEDGASGGRGRGEVDRDVLLQVDGVSCRVHLQAEVLPRYLKVVTANAAAAAHAPSELKPADGVLVRAAEGVQLTVGSSHPAAGLPPVVVRAAVAPAAVPRQSARKAALAGAG
mmetsp:Transcript_21675/g.55601  ORF Transcript_21675/g.55601 Transcript_21675/m.55601 type:complete len:215 (-) Transcript_21675:267-911(-)